MNYKTFTAKNLKIELDELLTKYNQKTYQKTDPVQFVYKFKKLQDREIAAFVSAAFAYGRVENIISSLEKIFSLFYDTSIIAVLANKKNCPKIENALTNFKHRFNNGADAAALIYALAECSIKYGSLEKMFLYYWQNLKNDYLLSLINFANEIKSTIQKKITEEKLTKKTKNPFFLITPPKKIIRQND